MELSIGQYYSIVISDNEIDNTTTIEYGNQNSKVDSKKGTKTHKDISEAIEYLQTKLNEKLRRGYNEISNPIQVHTEE